MVGILEAILLGVIQGLTEWLPVSSSGHLAIAQQIFGLEASVFFDIVLHMGTLLVILIVFWKDIAKILYAIFKLDFKSEYGKLAIFIILGSIPTALIGYFFRDLFASFFTNLLVVGIALLATGGFLFASKFFQSKRELSWTDSILIGIAQGMAIIPGISRSGITISTGLLRGIDRLKIARFSFILFIPAVLGALFWEGKDLAINSVNWISLFAGFLAAFTVGYLTLKWLLKIIKENQFHLFAYYCWSIGIIILLYSFITI